MSNKFKIKLKQWTFVYLYKFNQLVKKALCHFQGRTQGGAGGAGAPPVAKFWKKKNKNLFFGADEETVVTKFLTNNEH